MKRVKISFSVVVRVILWLILLIGGAFYSISKDLNNPYFNNLWFHLVSFIVGVIVLKFAFRAAAAGGRELARRGREGDLPRLETNKLVTSGVYSCTRHPMLFGLILLPLGVALLIGSPTFIFKVAPLEMLFIIFMIVVFEERECRLKFKEEYIEYSKKTPIFPTNKECLKKIFLE